MAAILCPARAGTRPPPRVNVIATVARRAGPIHTRR